MATSPNATNTAGVPGNIDVMIQSLVVEDTEHVGLDVGVIGKGGERGEEKCCEMFHVSEGWLMPSNQPRGSKSPGRRPSMQ